VTIALAGPMDVAFAKLPGSNLLRDPDQSLPLYLLLFVL